MFAGAEALLIRKVIKYSVNLLTDTQDKVETRDWDSVRKPINSKAKFVIGVKSGEPVMYFE